MLLFPSMVMESSGYIVIKFIAPSIEVFWLDCLHLLKMRKLHQYSVKNEVYSARNDTLYFMFNRPCDL